MTTTKKIEVLTVDLEAKPGALARVYSAFRESKINVTASWAYQMGPGQAQAHFYVSDVSKAKDVLGKLGRPTKVETAVWAEDKDEVGRYGDVLDKIAKAGINIEATEAFGLGGKMGTVIFVQASEIAKLCQTLGC